VEHYLKQTITHECAHLIAYNLYGSGISPHGVEWKGVMADLGVPALRCHEYDISNVQHKQKRNYKGYCKVCDKEINMTRKQVLEVWRFRSRCHGAEIKLDGNMVQYDKVAESVKVTVLSGTQIKAKEVIKLNVGKKSSIIIGLIRDELSISEGYARTLYYTLKNTIDKG
jgi:hypothetical protein